MKIARIIKVENVDNIENLLKNKPDQTPFILTRECAVNECALISRDGYILVDFGKEIHGGIKICIQGAENSNAKIRITFGESVMETLSELGEKNSGNYHSLRDMVIPAVGLSIQKLGDTGFRFVKIQAIDADISLYSVIAVPDIREIEYKGNFECSDERLNEIWQIGAYTVLLNTHDYIWDGIKRDRLVWIGDMHPEVSTIRCVFGDDESVPRSLDFVKEATPPGKWMNETATYSMWWIIIHYDWYMHWGNIEYLSQQREYLETLVEHTMNWLDEDSVKQGMESFVDWSSKKDPESETEGRNSIICMGLDCARKLFDVFGDKERSSKCREYVNKFRSEISEKSYNKRVSALTVLSGRNSEFAKEVISGNSPKEMSCFMGYYILKAKAMLGEYADAVDIVKSYWGSMIDKGATTFWEDFDIEWVDGSGRIDEITPDGLKDIHGDFGKHCYLGFRHSLCHGWASGPTPFLMEEIGGIEIVEPGCKKIKVSPKLGNLEWIKITYPTPHGPLKIMAEKIYGEMKINIEAPDCIEIIE